VTSLLQSKRDRDMGKAIQYALDNGIGLDQVSASGAAAEVRGAEEWGACIQQYIGSSLDEAFGPVCVCCWRWADVSWELSGRRFQSVEQSMSPWLMLPACVSSAVHAPANGYTPATARCIKLTTLHCFCLCAGCPQTQAGAAGEVDAPQA
jgi:hypothetical protein